MGDTTGERASALDRALWWLYDHAPPFVQNWMPEHQECAMATEQYEQHLNRHGLQETADGLGLPPAQREVETLSVPLIEENPFHALYFPLPENADRTLLEAA